ncbi:MAG: ATP-dependent protease ATPase subunit HslU [Acidobacteria bacterium]|nr:ATP-dependent protease ATPase subunit HslU [Acidobacteriota bacterium]
MDLDNMTPRQIVAELDKYVVGQDKAKKAVAIALRNRIRRLKLPKDLAQEVAPKNIIMIGSTGVGKTEIARRLATLARSPFIKVEATKYTEVGYVGRDVESMVRDLVNLSVNMVKEEMRERVKHSAEKRTEERLLDLLLPPSKHPSHREEDMKDRSESTRDKIREQLRKGVLDDRTLELDVQEQSIPHLEIITGGGIEEMGLNMKEMFPNIFGKSKKRRLKVSEAREYILSEEQDKLIDQESISKEAVARVENSGIIFIDEFDKIAGRNSAHGPDVSREGVQRDILPIVEGTTVHTKHGMVKTDHILFIAAGAFHTAKPSDLVPELQGRFPIRVELDSLKKEDFIRILEEPKNSLTKQYVALLETEGLKLDFPREGLERIADLAEEVNSRTEDIGARRLYTLMEKLLEEISFLGNEIAGKSVTINREYVDEHLQDLVKDYDLSKYIL